MAGQKGRDVLLRLGDGLAPEGIVIVAGIRTRAITLESTLLDATGADAPNGWRALMPGAGLKSMRIAGAGVFKDAASDAAILDAFFARIARRWEIVVPDFGVLAGPFLVERLEYGGEQDGEATFAIALASAGDIAFSPA